MSLDAPRAPIDKSSTAVCMHCASKGTSWGKCPRKIIRARNIIVRLQLEHADGIKLILVLQGAGRRTPVIGVPIIVVACM